LVGKLLASPTASLLLLSYRRLRGKLGLEEGSLVYCEIPHQNSSPKTLADEVKETIEKRVDDIEN
jgi:hypothetical protein